MAFILRGKAKCEMGNGEKMKCTIYAVISGLVKPNQTQSGNWKQLTCPAIHTKLMKTDQLLCSVVGSSLLLINVLSS